MVTASSSAYLTISDHHFAVVRQNTSNNQKAFLPNDLTGRAMLSPHLVLVLLFHRLLI